MTYTVWLVTRPISSVTLFPPFSDSSNGKDHLRHWGVLVGDMTIIDAKAIMLRSKVYGANDNTELGTLYELFRDDNDRNNLSICRSFGIADLRNHWRMFSIKCVGRTDMTHESIKQEAIRIINQRPDFELFENNCQNFTKYLLEVVCPNAPIPETIRCVLKRWRDMSTVLDKENHFPGSYPRSLASDYSSVLLAGSGNTRVTASGDDWVTAMEYISSPGGNTNSRQENFDGTSIEETRSFTFRSREAEDLGLQLIRAVTEKNRDAVAALIEANTDILISDPRTGLTALHIAAQTDDEEILKFLLGATSKKAKSVRDWFHKTGLRLAIKKNLPENVRVFLEVKTKNNLPRENDSGPLRLAILNNCAEIVLILLDANSYTPFQLREALSLAIREKKSEIVKLLLGAALLGF